MEGQTSRLSLHPAFPCPAARHMETKGLKSTCRKENNKLVDKKWKGEERREEKRRREESSCSG